LVTILAFQHLLLLLLLLLLIIIIIVMWDLELYYLSLQGSS
jgi:hypothetical protein